MEGKKVGINYSFWSGTTLTVRSESTEGGYVNFKEQEVLYGGDTLTAFATAFEGYRFVKWTDSVTDISRTERNVTEDITLTAIFEKNCLIKNFPEDAGKYWVFSAFNLKKLSA